MYYDKHTGSLLRGDNGRWILDTNNKITNYSSNSDGSMKWLQGCSKFMRKPPHAKIMYGEILERPLREQEVDMRDELDWLWESLCRSRGLSGTRQVGEHWFEQNVPLEAQISKLKWEVEEGMADWDEGGDNLVFIMTMIQDFEELYVKSSKALVRNRKLSKWSANTTYNRPMSIDDLNISFCPVAWMMFKAFYKAVNAETKKESTYYANQYYTIQRKRWKRNP